jgi:hypothetical protein
VRRHHQGQKEADHKIGPRVLNMQDLLENNLEVMGVTHYTILSTAIDV